MSVWAARHAGRGQGGGGAAAAWKIKPDGLRVGCDAPAVIWCNEVDTRLSDQALHAIRIIVRLIRQGERKGGHRNLCNEEQLSALEQHFRQLPSNDLLAVIRRHRLESFLQRNQLTERLMPELAVAIRSNAHQETIVSLTLISLIREISARFEQAGLAILFFKGIALSLQTTGLVSSRGSGDVDILVNPNQLVATVELLETAGFRREPGRFPQGLESLRGRYSRWAYNELLMTRKGPSGIEQLDLHWALATMRAPLPSFEAAWDQREKLSSNGFRMATLCRRHAFEHACVHAAVDQWKSLRHLIDIDRLASELPDSDLADLSDSAALRCSCAAAFDLFRSDKLQDFANQPGAWCQLPTWWVVQLARRSQALPDSQEKIPWSLRQRCLDVWRQASLSSDWRDWLRIALLSVFWPGAFSDPNTGQERSFLSVLKARRSRLMERLCRK